jgi:hypothetical protein
MSSAELKVRCRICKTSRPDACPDGVLTSNDACPHCLNRAGELNYSCEPEEPTTKLVSAISQGSISIRNAGWEVTIKPDGSFTSNGEHINADDTERGKLLYEAFCKLFKLGHTRGN